LAAGHGSFKAKLTGKAEVPPVMVKSSGEAYFKLSKDGKKLDYRIKVKNIENTWAAHIHKGKKGENGEVVVVLFSGPKKEGKFSGVLAKGAIMDKDLSGPLAGKTVGDLVKLIKEGDAYVNVHTDKYKDGEIRGQIK
jgi:hypothetical protein